MQYCRQKNCDIVPLVMHFCLSLAPLSDDGVMNKPLPPLSESQLKAGLDAAIAQAEKGWREGGIPIGSSLLDENGVPSGSRHH